MTLDFFGRKIELTYKPYDHYDLSDCVAMWHGKENRITLADGMSERITLQALFHEWWHVVFPYESEPDTDSRALILFESLWANGMIRMPKEKKK